jgi:hypothetical protein
MWGCHPLLADLDRGDGASEALAGRLRPGNAGANTAADHVAVCAQASWQLPELPAGLPRLMRADSAGASINGTQTLTLDGELRLAESQQLRRALLPVPVSIARHTRKWWLHGKAGWPWTPALVTAPRDCAAPPARRGGQPVPKAPTCAREAASSEHRCAPTPAARHGRSNPDVAGPSGASNGPHRGGSGNIGAREPVTSGYSHAS